MRAPLKVAVVGHTNTGKTSLLRTLTRDVTFGEVSDRPAVTREVAGTVLTVRGEPLIQLYDTPGLEDSISLLDHLESMRGDRRADDVELVRRLLASPEARGAFGQESKALGQVLASDMALYIIDARDRVRGKHRDELRILSMCARPIVPVLNFVARPEARTAEWRDHLSRAALHAVAEFDTVVVTGQSEQRLYEKMITLLDAHRETLEALIEDRREQRRRLVAASAELLADLLVDVAAYRVPVPLEPPELMQEATTRLRGAVRRREQQCVTRLLELHRFHPDDCEPADLPLTEGRWGLDLFSPAAMRQFGIRAGSAAAAGAMAGLALDVMVGGLTLGAGTAAGATLGALFGAGRTHGRRLLERMKGMTELRCADETLRLLEARQRSLVRALLTRGHASQERLRVAAPGGTRDSSAHADRVDDLLQIARTRPDWSRLATSHPANGARQAVQQDLAKVLEPALRV